MIYQLEMSRRSKILFSHLKTADIEHIYVKQFVVGVKNSNIRKYMIVKELQLSFTDITHMDTICDRYWDNTCNKSRNYMSIDFIIQLRQRCYHFITGHRVKSHPLLRK